MQVPGCSECAPAAAGLQDPQAERAAGGGGGVFFSVVGTGVCWKKQRGAPTAAGRAGIECAAVGGGGVFMTVGGIEPPLLCYESICLTSGPVQASYPMLRVCSTNMHMR